MLFNIRFPIMEIPMTLPSKRYLSQLYYIYIYI
jgi:hypothetical protein